MRTSKRRQDRTAEGCRDCRKPSPEARARYAEAVAQASLRRMHPRF